MIVHHLCAQVCACVASLWQLRFDAAGAVVTVAVAAVAGAAFLRKRVPNIHERCLDLGQCGRRGRQ